VGDQTLADDVTQDVFLHLWRHPDRWNPNRGDFSLYVRVLAKSRAVDALRSARAGRRALERVASVAAPTATAGADEAVAAASSSEALRAEVAKLPRPQREAVALTFWGGLTASEIAHRCSIPHGTAKGRVRLGLKKLRGAMALAWVMSFTELIEDLIVAGG
jgi:RNA polymerase sigma-70 factor (ECF subfamily)